MSLNIYLSEQTVHYGGPQSNTYYGWYVSTSSYSMSCCDMESAEARDKYVEDVKSRLTDLERAHDFADDIAPLVYFALEGNSEEDRNAARMELEDYFGLDVDADQAQDVDRWEGLRP